MRTVTTTWLVGGVIAALAATAVQAQPFDLSWYTIDGGGAETSGGTFALGSTTGQPDATNALSGGTFTLNGGFWATFAPDPCYANCDGSTVSPILNANDFQCFLNKFAAADPYANCDGSTVAPVLNANDFQCFINAFAAGCS